MGNPEQLMEVTFLVTIMLLAPIAGVAGASGSAGPAENVTTTESNSEDYVELHDDIKVWDRTPLSLQADSADANVSVDLLGAGIQTTDGYTDANRSSVGIYETDKEVTLRFGEHQNVNANGYNGDDVQLLIGHLEEDVEEDDVNLSDVPMSGQALMDELTQENLDNLNDNVSFSIESDEVTDGTFTYDDDLDDGPGVYTYIVATEDSFEIVDDDDVAVNDATILGAESLVAHNEPSEVNVTSSAEPGDDISFDVTATDFDGDALNESVNHAVVLYHEQTFLDSTATVNVTKEINTDLSAEDIILETDIGSLNGVQKLETNVSALGYELESQNQTGLLGLDTVVNFLADETDLDERPGLDEGNTVLDASSTALVGNTSEELVVETNSSWSEGDYQWIHVATGTSSDQIQVNADMIEIEEEDTSNGGGIGGGGGDPAEPDFQVTKAGLSDSEIAPGESVDVTAKIEEVSGDRGGQFTAELVVDGEVVDEQTVTVFGGESEDVTFTKTFDETGEYEIKVSGAPAGTLTVSDEAPKGPSDDSAFEITNTGLNANEVGVGDEVEATATIENIGGEAGTFTAEFIVDGEVVDEQTVTLDAGGSQDVVFTHSFDEAGEYTLAISDSTVGTVTVSDDSGLLPVPGFGMGAALAALLAVALLGARLQD